MQRYFHDDNVVKAVTAKLGVKLVNTDFSRSLKIAGNYRNSRYCIWICTQQHIV